MKLPKFMKYTLPLLLFCLLIFNSCTKSSEQEPLEEVFRALDIELAEMRLVVWKPFAEEFLPSEELQSVLNATAANMELKILSGEGENTESYRSYTMLAEGARAKYTLIAQSIPNEGYLIISAVSREDISSLSALSEELLEAAGEGSSLNALLIGYRASEGEQGAWQQEITSAISACGGEIVEESDGEGYYSCSAYCAELKEAELSGEKQVNLQLAVSYDEEADCCYYYLGYPLIYNDY